MIEQYLIYFLILALLFFGISLTARKGVRLIVVGLNIIFLIFVYYSIVGFSGLARPLQYGLPFFGPVTHFDSGNVHMVEGGYITSDLIYLIITTGKDDVRLVSFKNTPEFLAEINHAIDIAKGFGFVMTLSDTLYGAGTEAHVDLGQFQQNTNVHKDDSTPPPTEVPIQ